MFKSAICATALFSLFSTGFAGTPTLDGIFDGAGVWGSVVSTDPAGDHWGAAGADATELYATDDATYIYLGAVGTGFAGWQSFGFAINNITGGGNVQDPWGRQITFNWSGGAPDFVLRGNVDNGWRELRTWNGTDFNTGSGANLGATESVASGNFIEVRIPKATIGSASSVNAEFFITGDQAAHGVFDSVPNDSTATAWNQTPMNSLTNPSSAQALPVSVSAFTIE